MAGTHLELEESVRLEAARGSGGCGGSREFFGERGQLGERGQQRCLEEKLKFLEKQLKSPELYF